MIMGGMYTFFTMADFEAFKKSTLYKSLWDNSVIALGSVDIKIHENLMGGEETHEMCEWPISGDRMPIVPSDLTDAWLLIA